MFGTEGSGGGHIKKSLKRPQIGGTKKGEEAPKRATNNFRFSKNTLHPLTFFMTIP